MISDIKLKIRHAKRSQAKELDLKGIGMSEVPPDILQLTMLEKLDVSGNKLQNLNRITQLPNL